ncbi:MAG: DNA-binding protein [Candidatus Eisenbacteria bacterium]|nr:DNA-binding protein [Candidatus Eisenbacteria bacterium]
MNKADLVREIAARRGVSQTAAAQVVDALLAVITRTLSDGERVELRRLGTFDVRRRAARSMRNPQSGERHRIPARLLPVFRSARPLVEKIQSAQQRA